MVNCESNGIFENVLLHHYGEGEEDVLANWSKHDFLLILRQLFDINWSYFIMAVLPMDQHILASTNSTSQNAEPPLNSLNNWKTQKEVICRSLNTEIHRKKLISRDYECLSECNKLLMITGEDTVIFNLKNTEPMLGR